MIVRHLAPNEDWPAALFMGFTGPQLDRDWAWVAEDHGQVMAGLLACPMHGIAFLMRLAVTHEAPQMVIRSLLAEVARELRERGCMGWVSTVDIHTREGRGLARLATRKGGFEWPDPLTMIFGSLAGMERF
jgi:hypothetical protein